MREQAEESLVLEVVDGISLGWGAPGWAGFVSALPRAVAGVGQPDGPGGFARQGRLKCRRPPGRQNPVRRRRSP